MLSHTKPTGMSLKEVHQFIKNGVLVSDLKSRKLIARNKKKILDGLFKDCLTRGGVWKRAFNTKEQALAWNAGHKDLNVYAYKCDMHGYHVSYKDSKTETRRLRRLGYGN